MESQRIRHDLVTKQQQNSKRGLMWLFKDLWTSQRSSLSLSSLRSKSYLYKASCLNSRSQHHLNSIFFSGVWVSALHHYSLKIVRMNNFKTLTLFSNQVLWLEATSWSYHLQWHHHNLFWSYALFNNWLWSVYINFS